MGLGRAQSRRELRAAKALEPPPARVAAKVVPTMGVPRTKPLKTPEAAGPGTVPLFRTAERKRERSTERGRADVRARSADTRPGPAPRLLATEPVRIQPQGDRALACRSLRDLMDAGPSADGPPSGPESPAREAPKAFSEERLPPEPRPEEYEDAAALQLEAVLMQAEEPPSPARLPYSPVAPDA